MNVAHEVSGLGQPFFRIAPDGVAGDLVTEPIAASNWTHAGPMVRGLAVSGLLARAAEAVVAEACDGALHPTRWTVELFRPVALGRVRPTARVLRRGRRLCLVQADLLQDGEVVSTARGLFLRPGQSPSGATWTSGDLPHPPPSDLPVSESHRLYFSEEIGWTESADHHHNADRKELWQKSPPIVLGEVPSPFQMVAAAADLASVVTNWGTAGVGFVNTDLSLSLIRLPSSSLMGLSARDHWERAGVSVGTAIVFDEQGVVGTCAVSAIISAVNVDPGARDRGEV
jgi:Thioesterase-like superfamily